MTPAAGHNTLPSKVLGANPRREAARAGKIEQTITVTVPRRPARVGIDPYNLLIDLEIDDNIEEVEIKS